ncbi:MAG: motility associated factor glycosyltransferase family protein [Lachnospiraceae bacterium]|nr:motility associated factor glycosyltransferase family protein [Lachnospiraceae bacterium]
MNTLVLLCNKLRLVAQYCDDGPEEHAIRGMADAVGMLTEVAGRMMAVMQTRSGAGIDAPAFLGSLQLVLDAMQKKDVKMLAGALREGLLPELERARKAGIMQDASMPLTEAQRVEEEHMMSCSTAPVVCLFGYGDGAYYNELCAKAPEGSTFIVYEPETDNVIDLREELVKNIDFYRLDSTVILATPGYETVFAGEYADFVREINTNRERILVNKNTLKRFRDDAAKNVITNLHILGKANLIGELSAILPREVPVIIVSAGPSLDKNIELLKKAKGHSLIFAVDTAMKYLMQHDIMPDLGITVEPIKPMANYEDDRCFDVPHIFDCESNPEIVSRERSRIFIYNCRDYVKKLIESVGVSVDADVASGGSVATAAFAVCYQLQMKTMIMIGQDLAYSGTATHAGGVESAGINGDIGTELVDGIDGEPVRTRSDWLGYLRWFENAIATIKDQHLDMTVIDATEGGALIHGSHVMTLADAIEKYCVGCDYDFAEELKKLPYLLDTEEYAAVREKIQSSFDELSTVRDAAKKASALCDELIAGSDAEKAGRQQLAEYRRTCESALLYPLINNYAVSDIADEVNRLRQEENGALSEIKQQKLAFDAIANACDYFEKLRPEAQ